MDLAPAAVGAEPLLSGEEAVVLSCEDSIVGTYDGPAGFHTFITATADPNVVRANGSWGSGRPSFVCEMVRSSTSPLVWNGVLPPQLFGGAPVRWDFEPGMGAFTSTAGGKPPTRYVKREAYRDSTIAGTYDGPGELHCVIVATADPNVVQARGSWGNRSNLMVYEMCRSSTSQTVWNGVLPPHFLGGAPIRWDFEPGLNAFTSTAGGKPTTHYVKRGSWNAATQSQPTASGGFDIEEGSQDPALRNGQNWAKICCPLGGDAGACNGYKGVGAAYHEPIGCCCYTRPPFKDKPDLGETCCYCVFWLVVFGIGQIPLAWMYAAIHNEDYWKSVQERGFYNTNLLALNILPYLLPAWLTFAICIVWFRIAQRVFCMPYCTNTSMCPCTVHRVTPHFVRKYPHLVTRGPAAAR